MRIYYIVVFTIFLAGPSMIGASVQAGMVPRAPVSNSDAASRIQPKTPVIGQRAINRVRSRSQGPPIAVRSETTLNREMLGGRNAPPDVNGRPSVRTILRSMRARLDAQRQYREFHVRGGDIHTAGRDIHSAAGVTSRHPVQIYGNPTLAPVTARARPVLRVVPTQPIGASGNRRLSAKQDSEEPFEFPTETAPQTYLRDYLTTLAKTPEEVYRPISRHEFIALPDKVSDRELKKLSRKYGRFLREAYCDKCAEDGNSKVAYAKFRKAVNTIVLKNENNDAFKFRAHRYGYYEIQRHIRLIQEAIDAARKACDWK